IAPADPISLHFLERMGPINRVEVVEQAPRVGGDAEHPLAHRLADDREIAYLAPAIDDFLVGEHRAEGFAPPDGRFGNVSKTLGITVSTAFGLETGIDCRHDRCRRPLTRPPTILSRDGG